MNKWKITILLCTNNILNSHLIIIYFKIYDNIMKYIIAITFIILVIYINLKNTDHFYNKPIIWMYWENNPNKNKPNYLNLCYQTIVKNCSKNFHINLLNEKSVYNFLPKLRKDLDKFMSIPQKTDYIRLALLNKYGGIWIDSDTIVIKDLYPLYKKLYKFEFIGFGCTGYKCNTIESGYPRPSNWVLISRKGGRLVSECLKEADRIIKNNPKILRYRYHIIGRILLWNKIDELRKTNKWDYLHMPSKCIERDSIGIKYINGRLLSDQDYDNKCKNKIYFLPIYNTAPGFPKWFIDMTEKEIIESDMLISKMFKLALKL